MTAGPIDLGMHIELQRCPQSPVDDTDPTVGMCPTQSGCARWLLEAHITLKATTAQRGATPCLYHAELKEVSVGRFNQTDVHTGNKRYKLVTTFP